MALNTYPIPLKFSDEELRDIEAKAVEKDTDRTKIIKARYQDGKLFEELRAREIEKVRKELECFRVGPEDLFPDRIQDLINEAVFLELDRIWPRLKKARQRDKEGIFREAYIEAKRRARGEDTRFKNLGTTR